MLIHYQIKFATFCNSSNGVNKQLILSTLLAIISSSIPMGYGIGVLNCPQAIIREWIQEGIENNYGVSLTNQQNVLMWSSVISIFLVGSTIGALKGGALADKVGRRKAFFFNNLLCIISCGIFVLCKVFHCVEIILSSQLLFGVSAGISSCLVPLYISEIEPKSFKGMAVIHAFGISLGMFISQICGTDFLLGSAELWPYLLCIPGSGPLLGLIFYPYIQESPVYEKLYYKNQILNKPLFNNKKYKTLEKEPLLSTELISLEKSSPDRYTLYKLFKDTSLHKPILLTILLYIMTVFSGVNAIVAFGNVIFTSAGLNQQQSEIASICATGLQCIMALVSIFLTKKCRRRPLLLISLGGCIASLSMLMTFLNYSSSIASYIAILSCGLYFIFYAIGIGALACAVSAELLPENTRPIVISFVTGLYWISNILVGISFPLVQNSIGAYSLIFFIIACTISAIVFYLFLPETFSEETATVTKNYLCDKPFLKSSYTIIP